jgi:hypothetical protein
VTGREEHENRAAEGEDQPVKDSLRGRGRVFTVEASGPAGGVSAVIPVRALVQADAVLRAGMVLAVRMLSGDGDGTPRQWTLTGVHVHQDSGDPELDAKAERAAAESSPYLTVGVRDLAAAHGPPLRVGPGTEAGRPPGLVTASRGGPGCPGNRTGNRYRQQRKESTRT